MILPFNEMPLSSRIWIYQSDNKIQDQDLIKIKTKLIEFLKNWTAHGDDLKSSFEIKYNRFLIIALNEKSTKASGCSIDACVHFIQKIEKDYGLNLLDKMNVAFKQGDYISYKSIVEFKILIKNKSVSKNTIVFNNLVVDIEDYNNNWEVPALKSWHSRFF
jgi:hypothetical protein